MSGGVDPTIGAPTHGSTTAPRVVPAAGAPAIASLRLGQAVRAAVLDILPSGEVLIALRGQQLIATTRLVLEVGKNYDFVVAATSPRLTLTAPLPVVAPSLVTALASGSLGAAGTELGQTLSALLPQLQPARAGSSTATVPGQASAAEVVQILQRVATGAASAGDLQALGQRLGHHQEARVLRLGQRPGVPSPTEVTALQLTIKAQALSQIEAAAVSATASAPLARALVDSLSRIELDNAVRAEQGVAEYLPLPAAGGEFLREARMFRMPAPDTGDEGGAESAVDAFHVVLLLDLTQLGQVRVDVEQRHGALAVTFQLADFHGLARLSQAGAELSQTLEDDGLMVRQLRFRLAPGAELPVADLLRLPPADLDSSALVDLHV